MLSYVLSVKPFWGGKGAPANTKYTQQYAIDVGDVPGHQVRVAENHVTYHPPMIEGIKVVEAWNRYSTDDTDLNGQRARMVIRRLRETPRASPLLFLRASW